MWEHEATDVIIAELAGIEDPGERLRLLMIAATELEEEEHPDVRLLPSARDPAVGAVVSRVQKKRLAFLAECFRDLGFPPAESRLPARLAYSVYLGWFRQRLIEGSERATARERAAYQRRAVELLVRDVRKLRLSDPAP